MEIINQDWVSDGEKARAGLGFESLVPLFSPLGFFPHASVNLLSRKGQRGSELFSVFFFSFFFPEPQRQGIDVGLI